MKETDPNRVKWAYRLGIVAQGVILGGLLALALLNLWVESGDVRLFRYQSF